MVVAKQFTTHLQRNNLSTHFKSGFRSYQSTESAIVRIANDVPRALMTVRMLLPSYFNIATFPIIPATFPIIPATFPIIPATFDAMLF